MIRIAIVDYGMGNIKSVQRGFESVGATIEVSSDPDKLLLADKLVLPGVGAFEDGMKGLRKTGLIDVLDEYVRSGKDLLGICLGMQMMMERGEEYGDHQGLAMIPGTVVEIPKFDGDEQIRKIPHIGWSELYLPAQQNDWSNSCLKNTHENEFFYFVHSFMAVPEHDEHLLAQCEYQGLKITAAVKKDNITGFQFHPEKSGELGLKILKEFIRV